MAIIRSRGAFIDVGAGWCRPCIIPARPRGRIATITVIRRAFINVRTTGATARIATIASTGKSTRRIRTTRVRMTIIGVGRALIYISTGRPGSGVATIARTAKRAIVVGTRRVGMAIIIRSIGTLVDIGTRRSINAIRSRIPTITSTRPRARGIDARGYRIATICIVHTLVDIRTGHAVPGVA